MRTLRKISIAGFKSIASAELTLGDLNVVIGANGSGKSNFIGVFKLLERVLSHNLQLYVASMPDRFLHHGRKVTPALSLDLTIAINAYGFKLMAVQDTLVFEHESVEYSGFWSYREPIAVGHRESQLEEAAIGYKNKIPKYVFPIARDLVVYHFHDTSDASPVKQAADVEDNRFLRSDGANLPAYLYWLQEKHPNEFRHIEEHVQLVAPFFEGFVLAPSKLNERKIKLEWRQKGSDAYFDAYALSDGTLRFMCLATLLLQPSLPALILLDEPELGLHPFAIRVLAEMLEAASKRGQVILATQSVTLLNHFAPHQIIVAEHDGLKTTFKRLDEEVLRDWLATYSLGELWEKNILGGRP
ncbi:MAG: AAA family ATPase [Chloracidobacterium sp.]